MCIANIKITKQVHQRFDHQQFCGEVLERNGDYIKIDVKNRFVVGDCLELMTSLQAISTFALTEIKDKKGNLIEDAKGFRAYRRYSCTCRC